MFIAAFLLIPSLIVQYVPPVRRWVGLADSASPFVLDDSEVANENVDTRVPAAAPAPASPVVPPKNEPDADLWGGAFRDRWSRLREELTTAERSKLLQVLRVARGGPRLTPADEKTWNEVVLNLEQRWRAHSEQAAAAVTELPEAERATWKEITERLAAAWERELRPALATAGGTGELSDDQRRTLVDLQEVFDGISLAVIRDNTVMRSTESDAWNRLMEQLHGSDLATLQAGSIGRVGFLQLFKQPTDYRGKLVTVRGDLRLGYRLAAPPNPDGISEYFVFWLKPAGGPNRPMVVYSLELPPGFRRLADKDRGEPPTELDDPVEITGYFFKNWAYPAQDHTRVAPLMLARRPEWHSFRATGGGQLPTTGTVVVAVVSAILFAIGLATFVYYKTKIPPRYTQEFRPPVIPVPKD